MLNKQTKSAQALTTDLGLSAWQSCVFKARKPGIASATKWAMPASLLTQMLVNLWTLQFVDFDFVRFSVRILTL